MAGWELLAYIVGVWEAWKRVLLDSHIGEVYLMVCCASRIAGLQVFYPGETCWCKENGGWEVFSRRENTIQDMKTPQMTNRTGRLFQIVT